MNKLGTVLAIEAAVAGGSLSLWKDGAEAGAWIGETSVASAETLLPNIDVLLRSHDCGVRDLDLIVVSAGPGSFTGIRIGIATAMGLARGSKRQMFTVSLLDAILSVSQVIRPVSAAAIPMGRNAVCLQTQDGVTYTESEADFLSKVNDTDAPPMVVHESLYRLSEQRELIQDAGRNMAFYLASYCQTSGFKKSDPLFISKSF